MGCGCQGKKVHASPKKKKPCCAACALGKPCGSKVHPDEAQDRRLFEKLIREEERRLGIMATRKKTKKKATKKKSKKTAKRRKATAKPMTRAQACVVLCRQKYTKKSRKKK